jgi:RimJ/RimL family protein N-acetyltransferase
MEKMPFQDTTVTTAAATLATMPAVASAAATVSSDWREQLPVLTGSMVTLRELELGDAPSLLAMLNSEEVARFISPPPTTVEGFERFIMWAQEQRQKGEYVCFAVVPHGMSVAVGLFQVRRIDANFGTAEWGFALGSAYWGTGMFVEGGRMMIDFAIGTLGVHRLEARAAVANGRGNGALRKIGATQEGVLRRSFLRDGKYLDQVMWSIVDTDWFHTKAIWGPKVQVH